MDRQNERRYVLDKSLHGEMVNQGLTGFDYKRELATEEQNQGARVAAGRS